MNISLSKALTNQCCFDIENKPIIVGDTIVFSTNGSRQVYTATVIKIKPEENKLKFRHSAIGPNTWFFGKECLNISKQYDIDINSKHEETLAEEERLQAEKLKHKWVYGCGIKDSDLYFFQHDIKAAKPQTEVTLNDVWTTISENYSHLSDIKLFTKDKWFTSKEHLYNVKFIFTRRPNLPVISETSTNLYRYICVDTNKRGRFYEMINTEECCSYSHSLDYGCYPDSSIYEELNKIAKSLLEKNS